MSYPQLETSRLLLLPLSTDDVAGVQRHFPHWEIVQHLSDRVPWPYPEDGALTWFRDLCLPAIDRGEKLIWAIRLKSEPDETVGIIDYQPEDEGYGNRGFWLARHLHGCGYMTEAVIAFQDYILLERGVESFVVLNAIDNPASRRIKEKTGAIREGVVEAPHRNGCNQGERWLVTRDAWRAIRSSED